MGVVTGFNFTNETGAPTLNRFDELFLQAPEPSFFLLTGLVLTLFLARRRRHAPSN
jgi:hypothetical protein